MLKTVKITPFSKSPYVHFRLKTYELNKNNGSNTNSDNKNKGKFPIFTQKHPNPHKITKNLTFHCPVYVDLGQMFKRYEKLTLKDSIYSLKAIPLTAIICPKSPLFANLKYTTPHQLQEANLNVIPEMQ